MSKKFIEKLTEFLDSELSGYSLKYDYEIVGDTCEVTVSTTGGLNKEVTISFKNGEGDYELEIYTLSESWDTVWPYDSSVRSLWIIIASELWGKG